MDKTRVLSIIIPFNIMVDLSNLKQKKKVQIWELGMKKIYIFIAMVNNTPYIGKFREFTEKSLELIRDFSNVIDWKPRCWLAVG